MYKVSNEENKEQQNQPKGFNPKVLLIWLAILAAIIGLVMAQSGEIAPSQRALSSVDDLISAAKEDRIEKAVIQSDPKGGEEWYVVNGKVLNPAFEIDENQYKTLPFVVKGRITESEYKDLRSLLGSRLLEEPSSTIWTDLLFSLLPFLLIIGLLYFLFVRQLRMAGKGALNFGKSKAKMLTRENEKVVFKDVAGCDEAKEEVSEIVDFLKDPKRFRKIGGTIPKGVLMVGPPGTGKTLLAKAVAGEAEVPFFSISGSDFVEMFVGVGAARVRDMFEQGRKSAPCLIFIDEIDAVGRQRGAGLGGGNDEREQTLNSLLVEMDGFDGHEGVIIIAATNRPDVLDNALLRPGRFDRQVVIDLPDLEGREAILKVHAKKIKLSEDVELNSLARATAGFSGADLANLLNEGALIAARRRKKVVERIDLDDAREKISFGRERRRVMDDEDRKIIAYHEAGHAIVQAKIDDGLLPIHKVTIIPRGQSLGSTMFTPKKDILNHSKRRVLNQICCAMGGRAAEEIEIGDITSGAAGDIRMATNIARSMVCDWGMSDLGMISFGDKQDQVFLGKELSRAQNYSEETAQKIDIAIKTIIDDQYSRARKILEDNIDALHTSAEALLEHETIEGKHIHEILDEGKIISAIINSSLKSEDEEDDAKEADEDTKEQGSKEDDLDPGVQPAGVPA
ncbi:MAG: ATP-dependent zinc metalloprotease FtsH [Verrucomicrobiota bacterium]|nr:ATP-dependent zinc metalloprotease FtsH [Verrucomicrobiota bacterium]MEC8244236.1 ATP-dependent zinc metalloprotease FtsH [Verrucomicrobiota bacterium]